MLEGRVTFDKAALLAKASAVWQKLRGHIRNALPETPVLAKMPPPKAPQLTTSVFAVLGVLMSAYVMLIILNWGFTKYGNYILMHEYLERRAHRPFVYRFLLPELTNLISYLTPQDIRTPINDWLIRNETFRRWLRISNQVPAYSYEIMLLLLMVWGSILGFMWTLYATCRVLFPQYYAVALFAPFLGAATVPFSMWPVLDLYDMTELFLWGLCVYFIACERWRAFMVAFTLACMNKETAFLLAIYSLTATQSWGWRKQLPMHMLMAAIYLVIRLGSMSFYASAPGGFMEIGPRPMLDYFLKPWDINCFTRMLFFAYLTIYDWHKKPLLLKRGLLLIPVFLPLWIIFGKVGEIRALLEIYPPIILLSSYTLVVSSGLWRSPVFGKNNSMH